MGYDNHDCVYYSLDLQDATGHQSPIPNIAVYMAILASCKIICEFVNFEN